MKLLILGATGGTGKELVKQALEQEHEVTVLVRDPTKLSISHPKLKIREGDALDKEAVTKALYGKDAVISALGVGDKLKADNLITKAVKVLIPAMSDAGVSRLIFVSAIGVGDTISQCSLLQKFAFKYILHDIYDDKAAGDEVVMSSNLDWTIAYPVKMTNGARKGKYKTGEKLVAHGFPIIARADVADFLLSQLSDNTYLRKRPIVM